MQDMLSNEVRLSCTVPSPSISLQYQKRVKLKDVTITNDKTLGYRFQEFGCNTILISSISHAEDYPKPG